MNDRMLQQKHYTEKGIQPIEVILANLPYDEVLGFFEGNIIKYALREKSDEDSEKLEVYIGWKNEFKKTGKITIFKNGKKVKIGPGFPQFRKVTPLNYTGVFNTKGEES